ncbi:hypothetical protein VMF7928_04120 [Vibrio marisflavi CECT 7928]|uniref:Uncharacterized protein n=1 Tax=Vibrio marisflavi CECT 7928 TaxID=634439 RepID=A0ABM9A9L4_9VIBR|nr:hypothetical protein VMF7928_04120 [Vibrio marisflavi CECT 7928]
MSVYDTISVIAAVAVFISLFNQRFGKFQTDYRNNRVVGCYFDPSASIK